MNTYDPSDDVVYVRMTRGPDPGADAAWHGGAQHRLPRGYANKSLRTRLSGPHPAGQHWD